jgi:tRNA 2-selenouridine synthase
MQRAIFVWMGFPSIDISDFIKLLENGSHVLLDARSESEFAHSHIPGAINIPILNDDERKLVGTEYKHQGRERAILLGFRLVGPRFHQIIAEAASKSESHNVLIYCWRGGMRSHILSWLLSFYGFRIQLLKGGYKSYRNHVLKTVSHPYKYLVLGGATGSGKTEVLELLSARGEQVLNLERLAVHRGSAFGGIGLPGQPRNEHFENQIAAALLKMNPDKVVWVENESRSIGKCAVPGQLYDFIRMSHVMELQVPYETRKKRITNEYGRFPHHELAEASMKVKKRMGPQNLKKALDFLNQGDFDSWLDLILEYYDKLYAFGNSQRNQDTITKVETDLSDMDKVVDMLINKKSEIGYE